MAIIPHQSTHDKPQQRNTPHNYIAMSAHTEWFAARQRLDEAYVHGDRLEVKRLTRMLLERRP